VTPRKTPEPAAGEAETPAEGALPGAEWRKAVKAEMSAQAAAQRRGRVRRKPPGITGIVIPPPPKDAA